MVDVFPTPLTPTTINTYGFELVGTTNSVSSPVLVSDNNPAISSRKMTFSSSVPRYLSRATRASIRSIILSVVLTPTSLLTKISSRSSNTSSSTFDFPATALLSLVKKDELVSPIPYLESLFVRREYFFKKTHSNSV